MSVSPLRLPLLRRLAAVALIAAEPASAAPPVQTPREPGHRAAAANHTHQLTSLRLECLSLIASDAKGFFDVDVRERHTPACGGDPLTGPRLFTVRIRKRDGRMTSDVCDGVYYRPLKHKPSKGGRCP